MILKGQKQCLSWDENGHDRFQGLCVAGVLSRCKPLSRCRSGAKAEQD
ncbi:MAG: hypothetical protein ACTTKM_10750 [Prevotella fusca]